MKNYIRMFLGVILVGAILVSCQEELVDSKKYDVKLDPSKAPSATTNDPVKISAAYADLSGSSVDGSLDRGILISKTNTFASRTVISAAADGNFTVKAPSLSPNTTYYYRTYSTNLEGGTTLGAIKSFTTKIGFTAFSISYLTATEDDWDNAGFDDIDKDDDEESWGLYWFNQTAGQLCMRSYSWISAGALTPENYLLFPGMELDGVDGIFNIVVKAHNASYFREKFKVVISKEPITFENCQNAEVLFTHTLANNNIFTRAIDIPASYEGGTVYLAIAHFDCTDWVALNFLGGTFSYAK